MAGCFWDCGALSDELKPSCVKGFKRVNRAIRDVPANVVKLTHDNERRQNMLKVRHQLQREWTKFVEDTERIFGQSPAHHDNSMNARHFHDRGVVTAESTRHSQSCTSLGFDWRRRRSKVQHFPVVNKCDVQSFHTCGHQHIKARLVSQLWPSTAHEVEVIGRARVLKGDEAEEDPQADIIQFDFPGVCVKTQFEGTQIFVCMDGGLNYFNVFINDKLVRVIRTLSGVRTYELCSPLAPGVYRLCLSKRTEASVKSVYDWFGTVTLYGFYVHGSSVSKPGRLLQHPDYEADKERRLLIEFIGDSDTTSFGNEGPHSDVSAIQSMDASKQNAWNSYAAQAARCFDADYSLVAWTGTGVISAPPIPGSNPSVISRGMRAIFNRSVANWESEACHALPDLVVLHIGGNDLTGVHIDDDARENIRASEDLTVPILAKFIDAYVELLTMVRKSYPTTPIVCLAPDENTMSAESSRKGQAETSALVQTAVYCAVEEFGDAQTHFVILRPYPELLDPEDENKADWALLSHWSVQGHSKVAAALVTSIQKVMPHWVIKSAMTVCPAMSAVCPAIDRHSSLQRDIDCMKNALRSVPAKLRSCMC